MFSYSLTTFCYWLRFQLSILFSHTKLAALTIVVNVARLILGLVLLDSVYLHSNQWVNDGTLFLIDLRKLLPADHLRNTCHSFALDPFSDLVS